ncbi:MAG: AraC family transcriptional regulator [Myxococcales bacterium]|nr:AraC family transcriptional regulator [Myxococcales bacterium]
MGLEALADSINRHFPKIIRDINAISADGAATVTPLDGLTLVRSTHPTGFEATLYEPLVCLIVQGSKVTTAGDQTVTLSAGKSVVVSHDIPVLSRIERASPAAPYLALVIRIDLGTLRSLHAEMGDAEAHVAEEGSLKVSHLDAPTMAVILRYLDLLDHPKDARVLSPLVRRELHYRLLMSSSGGMLRSLLRRDSHASRIADAIGSLREGFRGPLDIGALARHAGMSPSSFHKHFRSVTRTTPLQYQKDLRLAEARALLRTGRHSVSTAAFEVGYESPSQFSREYSRKFGLPPQSDRRAAP